MGTGNVRVKLNGAGNRGIDGLRKVGYDEYRFARASIYRFKS